MNYFIKGRRCAVPNAGRKKDANSKAGLLRAKQEQELYQKEIIKFNEFINAESGNFNGFEFAKVFHENYNKKNAILVEQLGFREHTRHNVHVANDYGTIYFFVKPEEVKKTVYFNNSTYAF